jgi:hypothetical protein
LILKYGFVSKDFLKFHILVLLPSGGRFLVKFIPWTATTRIQITKLPCRWQSAVKSGVMDITPGITVPEYGQGIHKKMVILPEITSLMDREPTRRW